MAYGLMMVDLPHPLLCACLLVLVWVNVVVAGFGVVWCLYNMFDNSIIDKACLLMTTAAKAIAMVDDAPLLWIVILCIV